MADDDKDEIALLDMEVSCLFSLVLGYDFL